jgi:hypothetical protein
LRFGLNGILAAIGGVCIGFYAALMAAL